MAVATINRLITLFDDAFRGLSVGVDLAESERLAMVVQFAMDSKVRAYHTTAHIFGLCEGLNPHQTLAALFHDLVYYQLDDGPPKSTEGILHGVVREHDGALVLQPFGPDDSALALCAGVFDVVPGQTLLVYAGLNEFLSAVAAARLLQPLLPAHDVLAVVAGIEATIAFRALAMDGTTSADVLAARVLRQCQRLAPTWTQGACQAYTDQVLASAVHLANRDVGSFALDDSAAFLASTWLLIDESNAPLTRVGVYTLRQYREVLVRMETFLGMLDPQTVFQRWQGSPPPQEWAHLCAAATRNIAFACDFLDARVASIAIIEALAMGTGTDCPVSMFLGDIRSPQGHPHRVHDFLPEAPICAQVDADILEVFEKGRNLGASNNLAPSPLTAFVYRYMGVEGTRTALRHARDMFAGITTPQQFLRTQNREMVCAIILACSHLALSRRVALQELARSLA
ncbi:MAG: hypothetical protein RIR09_1406 [Pseudomonadota bacterium]